MLAARSHGLSNVPCEIFQRAFASLVLLLIAPRLAESEKLTYSSRIPEESTKKLATDLGMSCFVEPELDSKFVIIDVSM